MENFQVTNKIHKPRKTIYTVKNECPFNHLDSKYNFRKIGKRSLKRSASDNLQWDFGKKPRNNLKRSRAEIDISSGSTIEKNSCEPCPKRSKGSSGPSCQDSYTTDFSLKTIYKNPKFSTSRESVPNVLAPPVPCWSLESILGKLASECALLSRENLLVSQHPRFFKRGFTNSDSTVAIVTDPCGNQTLISMRKAVMMHVRDTTPCEHSCTAAEEENGIVTLGADRREIAHPPQEILKGHESPKVNFIHHVSSLELLRMKSSRTFTGSGLNEFQLTQVKEFASFTQTRTLWVDGNYHNDEEPSPQNPSTSKIEGATEIDEVPKKETDVDRPGSYDDAVGEDRQVKLSPTEEPVDSAPITTLQSKSHQPTTSRVVAIKRNDSKSELIPFSFLMFVCFILSRFLTVA